jgi:hypothetical protein
VTLYPPQTFKLWQFNPFSLFIPKMPPSHFFFLKKKNPKKKKKQKKSKKYARVAEPPHRWWSATPFGLGWFSHTQAGRSGGGRTTPWATGGGSATPRRPAWVWLNHPRPNGVAGHHLWGGSAIPTYFLDFFFFFRIFFFKCDGGILGINRLNGLNCHNLKVLRDKVSHFKL